MRQGRQWKKTVTVVRQVAGKGVQPDSHTDAVAINSCKRSKEFQATIELVKEMRKLGAASSVVAYTAAIAARANSGKCEPAPDLL